MGRACGTLGALSALPWGYDHPVVRRERLRASLCMPILLFGGGLGEGDQRPTGGQSNIMQSMMGTRRRLPIVFFLCLGPGCCLPSLLCTGVAGVCVRVTHDLLGT